MKDGMKSMFTLGPRRLMAPDDDADDDNDDLC